MLGALPKIASGGSELIRTRHVASEGKECLLSLKEKLIFLLIPLRCQVLPPKDYQPSPESYSIVKEQSSWTKGKHLVKLSQAIESP